jgi:hypothetical protein
VSIHFSGFQQRRSRAKLVSMEAVKLANLAANRDRHKLASKQEVVKNIIMKVRRLKTNSSFGVL